MSAIDVAAERDLTPGVRGHVFLDSAGSSLPPTPVVEAMVGHLRREAEVGGYRAALERLDDLERLPVAIGRLLGVDAATVALTDSATRSWTQFVAGLHLGPGDRVLLAGNEYASNAIALLQQARLRGVEVDVVPSDPDGSGPIDLAALARALERPTRLVSLVHVPTNTGTVAPVAEAARLARASGALVVLDACQAMGQLDVRLDGDPDGLAVDAVSATGRKWLRGPRGTGFLHVRAGLLEQLEPFGADLRAGEWTTPDTYRLRADARRFEQWEHDVAARLGLLVAVEHLLDLGPAAVEAAVRSRAASLRTLLGDLPGVTLHDRGTDLAGIVTFTVDGREPEEVRDALRERGVTVSVSGRGSTLLDMTERGLRAVVRASPHYFVDDADLDRAAGEVAALTRAGV
ncbi:aminotransferase class V-fold PLP-dependent enzyme [Nocardioides sp.]|uniref:aminotransferase class V-fold PLP-dependent enzyme n=1 Tax=Nocardioides sp. TaxID=35761 RepID=UPI0035148F79